MSENFDSKCSNPDFETFGLDANSSVLNTSSFFMSIIALVILHIFVISLNKIVDCCSFKCLCRIKTAAKFVLDKCIIIMTYGYYIRFILQMNQFLLVASFYEIYSFNLTKLFNILSFSIAILVLTICLCFTGIVLFLSLSSYETSDEKHNKIGEFFIGIKMEKKYKFFSTSLILRRTLFVILLINLMSIPSRILIIILGKYLLKIIYIAISSY